MEGTTVTETARILGIDRTTLQKRSKRHNILPTQDPDNLTIKRYSPEQVEELRKIISRIRKHGPRHESYVSDPENTGTK